MLSDQENAQAAPAADPPPPDLTDEVRTLARLRQERDELTARLDAATATFVEAWKEVVAARKAKSLEVEAAEARLKADVVAAYQATGDTAPAWGVKVKLQTVLDYQEEAALEWARRTGLALIPESLDRKAFEKLAKATTLDFVTANTVPQAQVATDLSPALTPKES